MLASRLLKFSTVGGFTTMFGIALYALLLIVVQVNLFLAYIVVFIASVTFSYLTNARFNYRITPSLPSYLKFLRSYAVGFLVGFVVIALCKAMAVGLSDFWIAMLSIPIRFAVTFVLADRAMLATINHSK